MEAGDEVVHELGRRRVVADNNEARWYANACLLPEFVRLLVVTVQRLEGGLQFDRQRQGIKNGSLPASLLRHLLPDVLPQVAIPGHLAAGDIVRHGDTRELHD